MKSESQYIKLVNAARRLCYTIAKSCSRPVLRRFRAAQEALTSLRLTPGRNRRRERLVSSGAERKRVTLFLAPEAGVAPFFASHALLARVMADAGHTAVLLSCNGVQP